MLGLKSNKTNNKRFKLIQEFYRFRKLRSAINKYVIFRSLKFFIYRLRYPAIIKQKKISILRPIFI